MILYTIGRRIKNFFKVKVRFRPEGKPGEDRIFTGDQFLKKENSVKDGIVCWSYDNGKIKARCTYKNYMLEGISTHYYESGKIKVKENYKKNKLNGTLLRYYEDGGLMSEENYIKGNLVSKNSYDRKGKKRVKKK